ncbi:MAG TPA: type I glyceraldehyde-3-phosphate dehydrogenase [Thermoanaerobaculia bacterium]|nr:type I glyceraldehyde-3-phosphate dehydrogenase [Thermoanaerobaculia bacterium]
MAIRVGIRGLGRIGRNVFRLLYARDDIRIAAVSEIAEPAALEYLLRFDSVLGRFPDEISIKEGNIYVLGRQIPLLSEAEGRQTAWGDLGVDTVIEATSRSRPRAELARHLEAGAKRVLSLAPPDPADPPDRVAIPGVNDEALAAGDRVVSNASSTVHCVAPVLQILQDAFGIRRGFFTTVHSYTSHQRLADVPSEDKRRGRAAAENIIPQASRSPAMLDGALPSLAGKITGSAMSVPVVEGSLVDLVCWHEKPVTTMAINEVIRTAASSQRWSRALRFERDPIVSKDVAKTPFSSVFDSLATMVMRERVSKTVSWFDSGYGYAHRAIDLLERYAALDAPGGHS